MSLDGRDDGALLALAAAAAGGLDASVGSAIVESARERDVKVAVVDRVETTAGAGVVACIDGQTVVVGTATLFRHLGLSLARFGCWPDRLQARGQQILFVAVDGQAAGFLGVTDSAA